MRILTRVLSTLFGAILFSIIVPLAYYFAFRQFPLDGFTGLAVLAGIGLVSGAILGALFPRFFGFIFMFFLGE